MKKSEDYEVFFNNLNQKFYNAIATDFDQSRQFFWEGWENLDLKNWENKKNKVLDLACGNGRFAEFLLKKGLKIDYLGLDFNQDLLNFAQKNNALKNISQENKIEFLQADLLENWQENITKNFDLIVSFGFLHHIPNYKKRLDFFRKTAEILGKNDNQENKKMAVFTTWNFLKNKNLSQRIVAKNGEKYADFILQENDFILDWQRGNHTQNTHRFCHFYSEKELKILCEQASLKIIKHFQADGKNADNDYWVLAKI